MRGTYTEIHMSHLKISFGLLLFAMLFPLALKAQTPVAAFTADTTTGCAPFPLVVNFQDQSTNNPTSWLWFFGDANGSSSTLQNPGFCIQCSRLLQYHPHCCQCEWRGYLNAEAVLSKSTHSLRRILRLTFQ